MRVRLKSCFSHIFDSRYFLIFDEKQPIIFLILFFVSSIIIPYILFIKILPKYFKKALINQEFY